MKLGDTMFIFQNLLTNQSIFGVNTPGTPLVSFGNYEAIKKPMMTSLYKLSGSENYDKRPLVVFEHSVNMVGTTEREVGMIRSISKNMEGGDETYTITVDMFKTDNSGNVIYQNGKPVVKEIHKIVQSYKNSSISGEMAVYEDPTRLSGATSIEFIGAIGNLLDTNSGQITLFNMTPGEKLADNEKNAWDIIKKNNQNVEVTEKDKETAYWNISWPSSNPSMMNTLNKTRLEVAGFDGGKVKIWNYDTQKYVRGKNNQIEYINPSEIVVVKVTPKKGYENIK